MYNKAADYGLSVNDVWGDMELRQIRYFLAVAETLHFGNASKQLNIAVQPLSAQIKKLESELGFELFERTTRSVRLTPAGEIFRQRAQAGMMEFETGAALSEKAAKGESGRLVVGYDSSVVTGNMPLCIKTFCQKYPQVELVLMERSRPDPDLNAEDLRRGKEDVSYILIYDKQPDNIAYEIIHKEPAVVAIPKGHRLASQESVLLTDLKDIPILSYSKSSHNAHEFIPRICRAAGFEPNIAQEAETFISLLGLVAGGMGVTICLKSFSDLFSDTIVYRTLEPKLITRTAIAWCKEHENPLIQNYVAVAKLSSRRR